MRFVTSLLIVVLVVMQTANAQSADSKYALVIHGGAGGIPQDEAWIKHRTAVLTKALNHGKRILADGGTSLDAVEAVIRILEDSEYFNAGKGAVCNAKGNHELDASIMDGKTRGCGAVGGVRTVKNPISLARRVMTDTRHVLLVTDGAEVFANAYKNDPKIERVQNAYFATEQQRQRLKQAQEKEKLSAEESMGTVGCVALDTHGNLAAGTSTGGLTNKKYGRVGDSPIVGAGTYADNRTCGVSCTGIGEDFIRHAVAYDVSARMHYRGDALDKAVREILTDADRQVRGGIIAISRTGEITMQFNTSGMSRAAADANGRFEVHVKD